MNYESISYNINKQGEGEAVVIRAGSSNKSP